MDRDGKKRRVIVQKEVVDKHSEKGGDKYQMKKRPDVVAESAKYTEAECSSRAERKERGEKRKTKVDFEAAVAGKHEVKPRKCFNHGAHFDAFMTGFVFSHLELELGNKNLNKHINKVYLRLANLDFPFKLPMDKYEEPSALCPEHLFESSTQGKNRDRRPI